MVTNSPASVASLLNTAIYVHMLVQDTIRIPSVSKLLINVFQLVVILVP